MTDRTIDDAIGEHRSAARAEPDAHGQAALFLAESLVHALVQREVLTLEQAIDAIRHAVEARESVAAERGESADRTREALGLLEAIARSLATETFDHS